MIQSSVATEVCDKENKKTITGDHVIGALKALGFDDYVDETKTVLEEHQKTIKTVCTYMQSRWTNLES